MANESRFSLFGQPTPADVRRSIGVADEEAALNLASLPAGRVNVAAGGLIGRKLGRLLSGPTPEEEIAKAKQEAFQASVDPDLGKFYTNLAQNMKDIDPQLSMQALIARDQWSQSQMQAEALAARREAAAAQDYASIIEGEAKLNLKQQALEWQKEKEGFENKIKEYEAITDRQRAEDAKQIAFDKIAQGERKLKNDMEKHGLNTAFKYAELENDLESKKQWRELQIVLEQMKTEREKGKQNSKTLNTGFQKMLGAFTASGKEAYARKMIDSMISADDNLNSFLPWEGLNKAQKETLAGLVRSRVVDDINAAMMAQDQNFNLYDSIEKNFKALAGSQGQVPTVGKYKILSVD